MIPNRQEHPKTIKIINLPLLFESMKLPKQLINIPLSVALSFSLSVSICNVTRAQRPERAPSELIELITKIDLAANNQDLETLQTHVSPQFSTKDGLNYESWQASLQKMWKNYPDLTYKTTLQSWEFKDQKLLARTLTEINGTFDSDGRKINLVSTINSLQSFQDGKLISQEILQERTDLTSGEKPPEVEVILPTKVRTGEKFNFDIILKEPLGYDLLLGAVKEEKIVPQLYENPSQFELQPLSSGGIFKWVTAPQIPDNYWYSAIFVRSDGIRLINQRVIVE